MWQKLLDWAKYFLKHKEQTERNSADIKEQERTIRELTFALQRVAFELERLRDNETHEREKLTLRLENMLLRSERSLSPAKHITAANSEELIGSLERLKHENDELRKRLEQIEKP